MMMSKPWRKSRRKDRKGREDRSGRGGGRDRDKLWSVDWLNHPVSPLSVNEIGTFLKEDGSHSLTWGGTHRTNTEQKHNCLIIL